MVSAQSLHAAVPETALRTFCSWQLGWRNVLLRSYRDPLEVDCFATTPTDDQKIVLVTHGSCLIQNLKHEGSSAVRYRRGHIGLVAPGESAALRWHGKAHHSNLQLHIAADIVADVRESLFGPKHKGEPLSTLALCDRTAETTILALEDAAKAGAPELYGESAAHYLLFHLLLRSTSLTLQPSYSANRLQANRLEEFMHANLGRTLTLSELAETAAMSRFQVLRLAHRIWGETPQRYLNRLRLNRACTLLAAHNRSILEIALECGFNSPSHFATAFRRWTGLTPSAYRQAKNIKTPLL